MSPTSSKQQLLRFCVSQLVLAVAVLAWAGVHWRGDQLGRQLPPLRETPRVVLPKFDYEFIVSDEQLSRVLTKLRPKFGTLESAENFPKSPKVNYLDHALRFWTLDAKFDDARYTSGEDLRSVLTDHTVFAKVYGAKTPPLLIDAPHGVRVRENEGIATSSHVDHTLACLAEVGTPLSFPLTTSTRKLTYRSMLEQSLTDFGLNQMEYEWSALTYALFLETNTWTTTEGQTVSFDMLAKRIMREDLPKGVCFGNHRLHTLTQLLSVDDQWHDEGKSLLSAETRLTVLAFLQNTTRLLIEHQHANGFWNADWPLQTAASDKATDKEGDRQSDRILATGHALEWWACAPADVHPPREVMIRAGQWLVNAVDELSEAQVQEYYTFLTHAGRALSIWRGKLPPASL
jgi:hypothetical protein